MHAKSKALPLLVVALVAAVVFPPAAFADDGGLSAGGANLIVQAASDHTADDAINWAKGKVGTPVGYDDGSGYYQCVEFIQAYYEYLGVSPVSGNGCDYAWNALPAGWTRTAGGQPQKGDILVYGAYGSQAYGHVAIYESDNSLYDQDGSVWGATVKHEAANYRTYTWAYWGCIHPNFKTSVDVGYKEVRYGDEFYARIKNPKSGKYVARSGNNVVLASSTNANRGDTIWKFVRGYRADGSDYYTITSLKDRKAIDVSNASTADGANIGMFEANGTDAQCFDFWERTSGDWSGTIFITPSWLGAGLGKAFDIYNASTDEGANIQLYTTNNTGAQAFVIEKCNAIANEGTFTALLVNKSNGKPVVRDDSNNIVVGEEAALSYGKMLWKFKYDASKGCYHISSLVDGWHVETQDSVAASGANITCKPDSGTVAGDWYLFPNVDASFTLCPGNSAQCMDVENASAENGANIRLYAANGTAAQDFTLKKMPLQDLSSAAMGLLPNAGSTTYTGRPLALVPYVTIGGATLVEGMDYLLSYSDNVNAGTATVTVTGIGAYTGEKSATFTIEPAAITSVEVAQPSVVYDGTAKTPELTVRAGSLVVPESGYDVVWSNDADTGAVTFAVVGKGNYTGRSNEIPVTVHVDSSSPGEADSPGAGASSGGSGSLGDSDLSSGGSESPSGGQAVNPAAPTQAMHRLYNPNSGEHFYTADEGEYESVVAAGWRDEGIGWTAPAESETPVFRMYNAHGGEHHYTTSAEERDGLVDAGWKYEGIGWYSDDAQSVPLYRDYNPNAFANNHNYTTSREEHEWLLSLGWRDEGYAWYGV